MQFQIKRGYKRYLIDENNNPLIPLEEGCWYLTLDTIEVFIAIDGQLKPLSQADINLDDYDAKFEDIETRLSALEANGGKAELNFNERSQFPTVGEPNILYIALDEKSTYIYFDGAYVCVGNGEQNEPYTEINGGSAD